MDHVVVDIEIQKTIEETPGGWDATDKLGVAVACLWEYTGQRMRVYGPNDVEALKQRLLKADRISGYNIWNFDFPVIWGFSKQDWDNWTSLGDEKRTHVGPSGCNLKSELACKTDDMLRRIWKALKLDPDKFDKRTHGGVGLDAVTKYTLNAGKIGNGADAPKWYQNGEVQRVVNYCADDVALERDLTDFVEKYGYVMSQYDRAIRIPKWNGSI
jgi:DEAD/DEAH box helicase domain-containing protein